MTGLLINGRSVAVPGLTVLSPASAGGPAWCRLDPGDYQARPTTWIRQIIVHSTKGDWPQPILPGKGPGGSDKVVADFWRGDPVHSAAQLVVDTDGTVACLCDLGATMAYHAEGSNPWSVGIEMYQVAGGGIYEATLDATACLVATLCRELAIPEQMPRGPYRNQPLRRMEVMDGGRRRQLGGPNLVGVFGHRDNTSERGRGDPGDAIWSRLATGYGFEGLDYDGCEDLEVGQRRQAMLVARGEPLKVDGVVGPASMAAMRHQGFARWSQVG